VVPPEVPPGGSGTTPLPYPALILDFISVCLTFSSYFYKHSLLVLKSENDRRRKAKLIMVTAACFWSFCSWLFIIISQTSIIYMKQTNNFDHSWINDEVGFGCAFYAGYLIIVLQAFSVYWSARTMLKISFRKS